MLGVVKIHANLRARTRNLSLSELLGVCRSIRLADDVELLPAHCSPVPDDIISVASSEVDFGIMSIFLRQVQSQLRITATDAKTLATLAWNSIWDGVLLSALYDCEAVCNFQCDKPVEEFSAQATLEITNYHLRGLTDTPRTLDEQEAAWVETNFQKARALLDQQAFQNAVHSLATYRWIHNAEQGSPCSGLGLKVFSISTANLFFASAFMLPDFCRLTIETKRRRSLKTSRNCTSSVPLLYMGRKSKETLGKLSLPQWNCSRI